MCGGAINKSMGPFVPNRFVAVFLGFFNLKLCLIQSDHEPRYS